MRRFVWCVAVAAMAMAVIGCSSGVNKEMLAQRDARISELENELIRLEEDLVAEENRTAELNAQLESALAEYKAKEQVWIEKQKGKAVVTVSDAVLFSSGDDSIRQEGRAIIDRIADVAKQHADRTIQIEGHTDDVPIGEALKSKYPSNWELSSARACSVLRYLYWKHKIDPGKLSALGFGKHRPIADNTTKEGRERNRRVVIVIGRDDT